MTISGRLRQIAAIIGILVGVLILAALAIALASAPRLRVLNTGTGPLPPASDRLYRVPIVSTDNPPMVCREAVCPR